MCQWELDPIIYWAPQPGQWGRTPPYLWVIGMAVCGDKDMAALATIWADNPQVLGAFVSH